MEQTECCFVFWEFIPEEKNDLFCLNPSWKWWLFSFWMTVTVFSECHSKDLLFSCHDHEVFINFGTCTYGVQFISLYITTVHDNLDIWFLHEKSIKVNTIVCFLNHWLHKMSSIWVSNSFFFLVVSLLKKLSLCRINLFQTLYHE